MKTLNIYRRDFRDSADYPHESLFEWILESLDIPKKGWDDIDEIEIEVNSFDTFSK